MRVHRKFLAASLGVAVVALLVIGCEDNGTTAPSNATLTLTASPTTIAIDRVAGEDSGQSVISALLFDANGFPLQGVGVQFETSGGTLSPVGAPAGTVLAGLVEVGPLGTASAVLTLDLNDDTTVDVTARSGALSGTLQLSKRIDTGNAEPAVSITTVPDLQQQVGGLVRFDGAVDDPEGDAITCYEWTLVSTAAGAAPLTERGPGKTFITRVFTSVGTVNVSLRASDDPAQTCDPVAPASLTTTPATISYTIACDLTPPLADAGNTQSISTAACALPCVTATPNCCSAELNGGASGDPDSGITNYNWSCGNGSPPLPTGNPAVVRCEYTAPSAPPNSQQNFTATLNVSNGCGLISTDTATVTVRTTEARRPKMKRRRERERGHLMAGLMAALAIMLILSTITFQAWSDMLRREMEAEMIFRAEDTVRAIQRYRKDHAGVAPLKLEDLLEPGPKAQYYARRLYKDPLVRDGKWGMLFAGPGGQIVDPNGDEAAVGEAVGDTSETPLQGMRPLKGSQQRDRQRGRRGEREQQGPESLLNPGSSEGEVTGLPIAGVKSLCEEPTFRVRNGLTEYREWKFTYFDLERQSAAAGATPPGNENQLRDRQRQGVNQPRPGSRRNPPGGSGTTLPRRPRRGPRGSGN